MSPAPMSKIPPIHPHPSPQLPCGVTCKRSQHPQSVYLDFIQIHVGIYQKLGHEITYLITVKFSRSALAG